MIVVQESVEDVVTHECTGGIRNCGGNVGIADGFSHFFQRNGCEIGGGAIRNNEFSPWLVARIVRNSGIPDVHGDPLRCDRITSAGLADAQKQIGLDFTGFLAGYPAALYASVMAYPGGLGFTIVFVCQ